MISIIPLPFWLSETKTTLSNPHKGVIYFAFLYIKHCEDLYHKWIYLGHDFFVLNGCKLPEVIKNLYLIERKDLYSIFCSIIVPSYFILYRLRITI